MGMFNKKDLCKFCKSERLINIGVIKDDLSQYNGRESFQCEICGKGQVLKEKENE